MIAGVGGNKRRENKGNVEDSTVTLSDSGHMDLVEHAGSGSEVREAQTTLEELWVIRYMQMCCEDYTAFLSHQDRESIGTTGLPERPFLRSCHPPGFFSGKDVSEVCHRRKVGDQESSVETLLAF